MTVTVLSFLSSLFSFHYEYTLNNGNLSIHNIHWGRCTNEQPYRHIYIHIYTYTRTNTHAFIHRHTVAYERTTDTSERASIRTYLDY